MEPKSGAAEGSRRSRKRRWRGRSRGRRELKVELFPSGGGGGSLASKEVTLNLKVSGAGLINRC